MFHVYKPNFFQNIVEFLKGYNLQGTGKVIGAANIDVSDK